MALSNTAVPKYYGEFRDAVMSGKIPVCREVEMEMQRIDELIADRGIYYDSEPVEGWIRFCEDELTLTDGSDFVMLPTFKLWGEAILGWYYFEERSVYKPNEDGHGGHYVRKWIKRRLINKQYLIVGRGASKSLYESCHQCTVTTRTSPARATTCITVWATSLQKSTPSSAQARRAAPLA